MNMNREIVSRALLYAGEYPLTDQDIASRNTNFQLCKAYYLETFLEALSEIPWTGGRRRALLAVSGRPRLPSRYRFVYDVPFDCAKPIELRGNEYFIIEDRFLHTDQEKAELLYVSNGKILRPVSFISAGKPGDMPETEYLSAGRPGTDSDYTVRAGRPGDIASPEGEPVSAEDYPDYRNLEYEPKFFNYIELLLAAKFAMKLSDQPQLHIQLMQEALVIKQEAIDASLGSSAARINPQKLWREELGLYAHNKFCFR